jgi:flagellar hook protein FlgE
MPSFYIPLSGLDADSTALNTIANNLANMNTNGFKSQTTNFGDLFYQQVGSNGSGDEIQAGTGVQVASNTTDFSGGSIASTGLSTDAAINGAGFFVLDGGGGSQLYTQNGGFQLSSNGTLQSSDGLAVMGYPATNGVVNTNGGLVDINIPTGQVMQPSATTNFSMTQNLDSQSAIGSTTTGQVQVYDSLGINTKLPSLTQIRGTIPGAIAFHCQTRFRAVPVLRRALPHSITTSERAAARWER